MTTRTRKERRVPVTGAKGAAQAEADAMQMHAPPVDAELGAEHMPTWEKLMRSRAFREWSETDLDVAARICVNTVDLRDVQKKLRAAGFTQYDEKLGRDTAHPLAAVAAKLQAAILAESRFIGLSSRSRGIQPADYAKAREAERVAREKAAQGDGLIKRR